MPPGYAKKGRALRTGTLRNYDGVNESLAEKKTPKIDGDKLQIFAKSVFLDLEPSTTDSDFLSFLTQSYFDLLILRIRKYSWMFGVL